MQIMRIMSVISAGMRRYEIYEYMRYAIWLVGVRWWRAPSAEFASHLGRDGNHLTWSGASVL